MKRVNLPKPPNPDETGYRNNPLGYSRATYDWMNKVRGILEQASAQNDAPLDQNFVISSYTTNTMLAGTSSGTDVSNFLCTLVDAFISRGAIKTNTSSA